MTPSTFYTRLQTLLKAMVWTGTTSVIFGENVFVVPFLSPATVSQIVSPTCYIIDTGYKNHDEHPHIVFQSFQISFFIENVNSQFGEGSMLSANRTTGTSIGAGLLDIEKEVMSQVIKTMTLTDAVFINEVGSGKAQVISGNSPLLNRTESFNVLLSFF